MVLARLRTAGIVALAMYVCVMFPIVLAQAQGAAGSAGAANVDEWGNSLLTSIFVSWGLRWLRERTWMSWFSAGAALKVQRGVAALAAFLSGLGVSFAFDTAAGTASVIGLPKGQPSFAAAVLVLAMTGLAHGIREFGFQEVVYQAAFKRDQPPAK